MTAGQYLLNTQVWALFIACFPWLLMIRLYWRVLWHHSWARKKRWQHRWCSEKGRLPFVPRTLHSWTEHQSKVLGAWSFFAVRALVPAFKRWPSPAPELHVHPCAAEFPRNSVQLPGEYGISLLEQCSQWTPLLKANPAVTAVSTEPHQAAHTQRPEHHTKPIPRAL